MGKEQNINKQTNTQNQEVVSYSKDKIQLLFNILNSLSFTGVQQAQGIAQISVILSNPEISSEQNKQTEKEE